MLWIIKNDVSYEIVSCNKHFDDKNDVYQLWITRTNGKSIKILESINEDDISLAKGAIDYAIENKETALRLE